MVQDGRILGFHAEDPLSGKPYFFLPGGAPEAGENFAETARREALEETGHEVEILTETGFACRYEFTWNGQFYDCETWFFLGRLKNLTAAAVVQDADYHRGVDWVAVEDIDQVFAYTTEILQSIRRLLNY